MPFKFNEPELLRELESYIERTYDQHYATDKYQATDIIIDSGHGTGFCLGNVIKYAKRYGRKGDAAEARKDLMKILHYALIQLHIHDEANQTEKLPVGWSTTADGKGLSFRSAPKNSQLELNFTGIDSITPNEWDSVAKKHLQERQNRL